MTEYIVLLDTTPILTVLQALSAKVTKVIFVKLDEIRIITSSPLTATEQANIISQMNTLLKGSGFAFTIIQAQNT